MRTNNRCRLYVRNLDEKIKIPALIKALRDIFSEVNPVVDVIAKKSIKRRGQAFVVFESADAAQEAMDTLQGLDVLGRPLELAFAKTRSDATVVKEEGEEALEAHKKQRLAEKGERKMSAEENRCRHTDTDMTERKQALEAQEAAVKSAKRAAEPSSLAERPAKSSKPTAGAMADEYNPPHKILILRDLPSDYTKEAVTAVFQRFPGLKEVRMVPGRSGLAFAEYNDEIEAAVAREAMNGVTLGDKTVRVTFQRSG